MISRLGPLQLRQSSFVRPPIGFTGAKRLNPVGGLLRAETSSPWTPLFSVSATFPG
jgi:hypothetical protein